MEQYFEETIRSIYNSAYLDHSCNNDYNDYLKEKDIDTFYPVDLEKDLNQLFNYTLVANYTKSPIQVSHIARTFYFNFSYNNSKGILLKPLTTRYVLYYLKTFGIKVKIEKHYRSLYGDFDAFLMDIVFTGKSKISIPKLQVYADECKRVKFKSTPWIAENEETDTDNNELSDINARFRGAEWFNVAQNDVVLVGAGGLGSNIAVSLCRVLGNHTLHIFDSDRVEQKNLAGQNFGVSDIGHLKTAVVDYQCRNFNPYLNVDTSGNFDVSLSCHYPIMITGLDNMAARQLVFSKWTQYINSIKDFLKSTDENESESTIKHYKNVLKGCFLIDARLSAEKWQILCVNPNNENAMKEYEDHWLFSDNEAQEDVCSYKQTAFAAQMCAGYVTNLYVNFCSNLNKEENDPLRRYVPFLTEYDATQMILRFKDL